MIASLPSRLFVTADRLRAVNVAGHAAITLLAWITVTQIPCVRLSVRLKPFAIGRGAWRADPIQRFFVSGEV